MLTAHWSCAKTLKSNNLIEMDFTLFEALRSEGQLGENCYVSNGRSEDVDPLVGELGFIFGNLPTMYQGLPLGSRFKSSTFGKG